MARAAKLAAVGLGLAGLAGGCGGASHEANPCAGLFVAGVGTRPSVAHPLSCAKRIRLAQATASLGAPLVLPRTTLVRPAEVGSVWVAGKKPRERTVAVTFPARGVIVEYTRPAPSSGSAAHFRAEAEGIHGREMILNGRVPALAVPQNSDTTGANFGVIAFNAGGSEIRIMGHNGEATLEAMALSILSRRARPASHHYSVRRVEQAFAERDIHLRDVTRKDFRGLVAFLDGRPAHAVYVYVVLEGCKCTLPPPIRHAGVTRHGNVEVLWLREERPAVRAALRGLD